MKPSPSLVSIIIKTKEGDTVGHVPDLLAHALAPEISGGNISIEAIVTARTEKCSRRYVGDRR